VLDGVILDVIDEEGVILGVGVLDGVILDVIDGEGVCEDVIKGLEDAVWLIDDVSEAVCVCVGDCELDEVTDCDEVGLLVGDTDTVGLGLIDGAIIS